MVATQFVGGNDRCQQPMDDDDDKLLCEELVGGVWLSCVFV